MTKVRLTNTCVTTIDVDGETLRLVDLANVAHLENVVLSDSP